MPENANSDLWSRFVRLGFRLLYNQMAWSYDLVAWLVSFGQWRTWGQTALAYLVDGRVLELGHGPGHLLAELDVRGVRAVGLDLSPAMGRRAMRRLRRAGHRRDLVRGRAQALPFPAQSFENVVATFPTPFIVEPATLHEIARVLRPGGRLVTVASAQLRGRDPLSRLIEWLYTVTGQREKTNETSWRGLFAAAGLTVRQEQVTLPRSTVLVWVAEPATGDDKSPRDDD